MRLFTLAVLALVVSGCESASTPSALQAPPRTEPECREPAPIPTGDALELLLGGVARAQVNDLHCGPPADNVRICRALFLVATVDPAHHVNNPATLDRVTDAMTWALSDALAVAPPEMGEPVEQLLAASATIAMSTEDADIVQALDDRTDPSILAPVDAYWDRHCQ